MSQPTFVFCATAWFRLIVIVRFAALGTAELMKIPGRVCWIVAKTKLDDPFA